MYIYFLSLGRTSSEKEEWGEEVLPKKGEAETVKGLSLGMNHAVQDTRRDTQSLSKRVSHLLLVLFGNQVQRVSQNNRENRYFR